MILNGKKIDFSAYLESYLKSKSLTQQDFCDITGKKASQVSRWITGINEPYDRTIKDIHKITGDFLRHNDIKNDNIIVTEGRSEEEFIKILLELNEVRKQLEESRKEIQEKDLIIKELRKNKHPKK